MTFDSFFPMFLILRDSALSLMALPVFHFDLKLTFCLSAHNKNDLFLVVYEKRI